MRARRRSRERAPRLDDSESKVDDDEKEEDDDEIRTVVSGESDVCPSTDGWRVLIDLNGPPTHVRSGKREQFAMMGATMMGLTHYGQACGASTT